MLLRKFMLGVAFIFRYKKKVSKSEFKYLSMLYDKLYGEADLVLRNYNPCNIKNGRCLRGHPCCDGCEYLSAGKGCTVKSLVCKLFLCDEAMMRFPECIKSLDVLEKIAKNNFPLGVKTSKEDLFSHYVIRRK